MFAATQEEMQIPKTLSWWKVATIQVWQKGYISHYPKLVLIAQLNGQTALKQWVKWKRTPNGAVLTMTDMCAGSLIFMPMKTHYLSMNSTKIPIATLKIADYSKLYRLIQVKRTIMSILSRLITILTSKIVVNRDTNWDTLQ